jgi:hypothetical protein
VKRVRAAKEKLYSKEREEKKERTLGTNKEVMGN